MELVNFLTSAEKKRIYSAVSKCFEQYRIVKFTLSTEREPAVFFNDQQVKFNEYINNVEAAVNELPGKEKVIITERYLQPDSDYIKDYTVYKDRLKICSETYKRHRDTAMLKLANMLGLSGLCNQI